MEVSPDLKYTVFLSEAKQFPIKITNFEVFNSACVMEKNLSTLSSLDSIPLSLLVVEPDGIPVKGVLQLVHGMAEHKERYLPMMRFLAGKGYVCVIHDNRGHGASLKSPADLGFMYEAREEGLVQDAYDVSLWIIGHYHNMPLFLFGHSMGSMIVRAYCRKHDDDIDGLIVCGSPSYVAAAGAGKTLCKTIASLSGGSMDKPGRGWRKISPILTSLATGTFNKSFKDEGSPNAWICSDPKVVEAYDADPLCGFPFTANGYYSLFALMQECYAESGWDLLHRSLPVHFLSGALDPCRISDEAYRAAVAHMKKVGYEEVTQKTYPGVRHEIHNDKSKDVVWTDIARLLDYWLDRL